ncbi:energy-coupling factor transporter ATPase, partial [Clostridiaceae bacterium OttesenSCG-928-D20]|nr:energy-coupling factor transporter ATPase [Clostridiaceae bacterium OttesenSCG-928-D20]
VVLVSHNMEDIARVAERIIVMNNSEIAMDGTPSEIFSEGERLSKMGLSIPTPAKIAQRLQALGFKLSDGIYTRERLVSELSALKGGELNA